MVKCPSEFCNHDNPTDAIRCDKCFLDLKLPKEEIEGRDKIYKLIKLLMEGMKKENPEEYEKFKGLENIEVGIFHESIEKHVGRLFMTAIRALEKKKTGTDTEKNDNIDKINLSKTGLYSIFLKRLKKLEKKPKQIINFPKVFSEVCANFKMTKEECWDILLMLNEFKILEIVPFNGIKLLY